ncbi:MarR family transcriptional regulator [Saccharopolyspora sp. NPDC050389]|uniref:MarR family winged helix-turn-helix transcriptional regulator n=1 Tax=Saccharopolyspora sp. NPDC050389 TaxID=3155516 RepID=UPI00340B43E4
MAETTADDQLWSQVVTLSGRVESGLAKALQRKHRLGLSEYRALCHLANADQGELRMQELADAVGLNQSSASRLVARLETVGLTVRDHCPADRRGVYSVITEAGRELQAAARPTYLETLAAALDRAAADPDLTTTVKALRG